MLVACHQRIQNMKQRNQNMKPTTQSQIAIVLKIVVECQQRISGEDAIAQKIERPKIA